MKPLYPDFIAAAITKVEENLQNEDFDCAALSVSLQLSRAHIHKKLKSQINLSTSEFIKSVRIKKAVILLVSTELSIKEIALKVGFSDPNYFTRIFSKMYQVPPSEFRFKKSALSPTSLKNAIN